MLNGHQATFWPFIEKDPQELACKGDDHKHQERFPLGSQPIASQPAHSPSAKKEKKNERN